MKNILTTTLTALVLASCGSESNYKIEGTIDDVKDGTVVYLQEISEQNQLANLDTTTVKDGKFSFDPKEVDFTDLNLISIEGLQGNIIFVSENEKIKVDAVRDSLFKTTIKGGEQNDIFKLYFDEVIGSNKERQRIQQEGMAATRAQDTAKVDAIRSEMQDINDNSVTTRMDLVEKHPSSTVSILILSDLIGLRLIDSDEAKKKLEGLDKEVQDSPKGKKLTETIAKMKSDEIASTLPEIGNNAPLFNAPTPEGKDLALADALGKYTIIDFWASWCGPCRDENPNVVNVYKKYHDKGLNIISVSLDKPDNKNAWTAAIAKDNMDWYHVSNLMFWNEPIARQYGITAIPATFLIDENGVIVDKNLRGEDLEAKMDEILGQG